MDLSPARWIWFPQQRCLHNTFILFRREIQIDAAPVTAKGWITADSRYRLTVNGQRVQWGPPPCDPRFQDADPLDLAPYLSVGKNVIGVEVCYFGEGDGTWPMGSPGFIFKLDVTHPDGRIEQIVSDASWQSFLDRAHRPGMYKRWYLRALQEEFDGRLHESGWDTSTYTPDARWKPAMLLSGKASMPAIFANGPEYVISADMSAQHLSEGFLPKNESVGLRARDIPMMREFIVGAAPEPVEQGKVRWLRDPNDWFESRVPDSFEASRTAVASITPRGIQLPVAAPKSDAYFVTFDFPEQLVGWPRFTIDASAGTIVELFVSEAHDIEKGPAFLDTGIYHWTRFICREGVNEFETFDYESFRWIQLHIRNHDRPVTIREVGARRRMYPWPQPANVQSSDPLLQKLFDASVNTLNNSAHEHICDGMGRERQQYSGDCGHQLQAIRFVFGETRQPARFLKTFSQGMTLDGYFLDCWPAFDRLARIIQRQMGTTVWGPLLDHGIGFNFDCWLHYMETGDKSALEEPYPRLLKFARYLQSIMRDDGMLPVENIGVPAVWMDHHAYKKQRHKKCAFNLYFAGALKNALAPMARVFGDTSYASQFEELAGDILADTVRTFWDPERRIFINNLPWVKEEGGIRMCDRSLAEAILYGQCPENDTAAAVKALADCPAEMGFSYPANAGWRLQALGRAGRADAILKDFRGRWSEMASVKMNNALQEEWIALPDSTSQWSHCALAPLFVLMSEIVGLRATLPGFETYSIKPQLADVGRLDVTAHTVRGPLRFLAEPTAGGHDVTLSALPDGKGEWLHGERKISLSPGQSAQFSVSRAT